MASTVQVKMTPFAEVAIYENDMVLTVLTQKEAEGLAQAILDLLQDEGQWKD